MKRRSKLTLYQYAEIRDYCRLRKLYTSKVLAKKYGVSRSLIQAISAGRRLGTSG